MLCLGFAGWLYLPGIHGPFLVDDYTAIVMNPAVQVTHLSIDGIQKAALSSQSGPLGRPLPMASFAIDHALGGLSPASFKATNIVLHLLITLLIFSISRSLLANAPAHDSKHADWGPPLLIAALWALHPLHVSTVLYAVQRMSQMAMLFMMTALWVYIRARKRLLAGDARGGWLLLLLCLPLYAAAMLSKENGALLPILLLVVEATFFRFDMPPSLRVTRRMLATLLAIPTLALLGWLVWIGIFPLPGSDVRGFTPLWRLQAEAHVLALYAYQIFWPDPANMPFYYDSIAATPETRASIGGFGMAAFWMLLTGVAIFCLRYDRGRWFSFAALWFLGGHLLESTTVPLELGFEHRNYLPLFGLAFSTGAALWHLTESSFAQPLLRRLPLLAIPAILAWSLHSRVAAWSSADSFFEHTLHNMPTSARAWGDYSSHLSSHGDLRDAIPPLMQAAALNPREAGYPMVILHLTINGLHVAPDPKLLDEAIRRLQHYPLTAYGHSIIGLLIDPLIEQTADHQGKLVLKELLEAAIRNPSLRPKHRETVALALLYLAKQSSSN